MIYNSPRFRKSERISLDWQSFGHHVNAFWFYDQKGASVGGAAPPTHAEDQAQNGGRVMPGERLNKACAKIKT